MLTAMRRKRVQCKRHPLDGTSAAYSAERWNLWSGDTTATSDTGRASASGARDIPDATSSTRSGPSPAAAISRSAPPRTSGDGRVRSGREGDARPDSAPRVRGEHVGDAGRHPNTRGQMDELVGAMRVRAGAHHAGDHELRP